MFDQIMARKEEINIAYYRKMKGLSQSQLAKASGVSVRSIQLFEQPKSNINNAQYNHLSAIAKVLGCEVKDLWHIYEKYARGVVFKCSTVACHSSAPPIERCPDLEALMCFQKKSTRHQIIFRVSLHLRLSAFSSRR